MESKKFIKCHDIHEISRVLNEKSCSIIAGGTDFVVSLRAGAKFNETFVDVSSVEELKEIKFIESKNAIGTKIFVGACVTHGEIEKSKIINENCGILSSACSHIGSTLIRNRGTIGGNVANNAACADSIPPLLLLDCHVLIKSVEGERIVPLEEFILENEKINLKSNEFIMGFYINSFIHGKWRFNKVGRRKSLAVSRLTLGVCLNCEEGKISDLRIAVGAMLPKHGRLVNTENAFIGKNLKDSIELIGESARKEAIDLSGIRWSTEYKEPVLKGLIIRSLEEMRDEF